MIIVLAAILCLMFLASLTSIANKSIVFMCFSAGILAILSLAFNPISAYIEHGNYTDLYRIFNELDLFRRFGWGADESVQWLQSGSAPLYGVPLSKIYLFLVSVFTSNNHILPMVNTLLTYGAIAIAFLLFGRKWAVNDTYITSAFVFFVIINDYSRVVANIRMPLATALFILILSIFYQSKRHLLVYFVLIIPCLLHNALWLYLFLYIIVNIIPKQFRLVYLIPVLFNEIFVNAGVRLLSLLSGLPIVNAMLQKVNLYTTGSQVGLSVLLTHQTDVRENFFRIGVTLIYLLFIKYHSVDSDLTDTDLDKLLSFVEVLTVFALGSIWSINIFNRTSIFLLMFIPLLSIRLGKRTGTTSLSIWVISVTNVLNWSLVFSSLIYLFGTHIYRTLIF